MKTIPLKFTKWGDEWTLTKRTPTRALYHRTGHGEHWEVVGIGLRENPHTWPNGDVSPAGEFLRMGDSDYGTHSWCCMDRESAERRFRAA